MCGEQLRNMVTETALRKTLQRSIYDSIDQTLITPRFFDFTRRELALGGISVI